MTAWRGWAIDAGASEYLFIITRDTNLWRKGQKVWGIFGTGDLAWYVIGRYRGRGRWITGWVHFHGSDSNDGRPDARYVGEVKIKASFKKYLENMAGL